MRTFIENAYPRHRETFVAAKMRVPHCRNRNERVTNITDAQFRILSKLYIELCLYRETNYDSRIGIRRLTAKELETNPSALDKLETAGYITLSGSRRDVAKITYQGELAYCFEYYLEWHKRPYAFKAKQENIEVWAPFIH